MNLDHDHTLYEVDEDGELRPAITIEYEEDDQLIHTADNNYRCDTWGCPCTPTIVDGSIAQSQEGANR